jgi:hypothetical protein
MYEDSGMEMTKVRAQCSFICSVMHLMMMIYNMDSCRYPELQLSLLFTYINYVNRHVN